MLTTSSTSTGPSKRSSLCDFTFSLSPPTSSKRGSRCLVENEFNEHCPRQREVLFSYFNFSLSTRPFSTRALVVSLTTRSTSTAPLKEKFSLPISLFPSLVPHPQREVLVVSLTTSSTSTAPLKEKFSLPISLFPSLLLHPQREVVVVSLTTSSTSTVPPKRSSLCVFHFFPVSSHILKERLSLSH